MAFALEFENISHRFGDYRAVEGVSLQIPEDAFYSLVGPSGCGKSTLLNIAAGLLSPTAGVTRVFSNPLAGINKRAGYMFQQEALMPWKTVLDNITLGPQLRGRDATAEAMEWIKRVGLEGFAHHYPSQLSGGMRKRVAMAQTWINSPEIILMDEPFGALDVHTRLRMESEILDLWTGSGKTVLFITHDLEEAIALSDRVAILSAGPRSRIAGIFDVNLPRPRNLIDIRTDPGFHELYSKIWISLREEVLKSYER